MGADITPDAQGLVYPKSGGMSVTALDPMALPVHRRPDWLGGKSPKNVVFSMAEAKLPDALVARQDLPKEIPLHRSIEPSECCTLEIYMNNLISTRSDWRTWRAE